MARSEVYIRPDGTQSTSRSDAAIATADDVVAAWRQQTDIVPAQFAVGTAQHETNFATNEQDTEDSGYVSTGIFQLSRAEAVAALVPTADLTSLDDSCEVFAAKTETQARALALAAGVDVSPWPNDLSAYCFIAHNQGLAAALKSIASYGMDWEAYKSRNLAEAQAGTSSQPLSWWQKVCAYGDDVISGGASWRSDLELPATSSDDGSGDSTTSSDSGGSASAKLLLRTLVVVAGLFFLYKVLA